MVNMLQCKDDEEVLVVNPVASPTHGKGIGSRKQGGGHDGMSFHHRIHIAADWHTV
jgi:hypothetical protein